MATEYKRCLSTGKIIFGEKLKRKNGKGKIESYLLSRDIGMSQKMAASVQTMAVHSQTSIGPRIDWVPEPIKIFTNLYLFIIISSGSLQILHINLHGHCLYYYALLMNTNTAKRQRAHQQRQRQRIGHAVSEN